jgi:hypothetical protein
MVSSVSGYFSAFFFLSGHLKERVFPTLTEAIRELNNRISQEINEMNRSRLVAACNEQFSSRITTNSEMLW